MIKMEIKCNKIYVISPFDSTLLSLSELSPKQLTFYRI